jgi:hypothetical protein
MQITISKKNIKNLWQVEALAMQMCFDINKSIEKM